MKKVLIVSPKFPYPPYGACELDRAAGIEMLIKLGYKVYVITKVYSDEYKQTVRETAEKLGITIVSVGYKYLFLSLGQKIINGLKRLIQPWYWDGAAFEYSDPEIRAEVEKALDSFQPDLVWFDYTYLWPLYGSVRKKRIPIITRSINFEPRHFLEEDGRSVVNYIKFLPKLLTEYIVGKLSDTVCSITPNEAELYKKIGTRRVVVLPLRGLPSGGAKAREARDHTPLNVFFSGSTYNVAHNREALKFLLAEVIPEATRQFPRQFIFHIFGRKIPVELAGYFSENVIKHNYLPPQKFEELMAMMDIAVAPSLYGAGMQQKIFEPLARGFPTITSARGLAGYPFKNGEHLVLAETREQFVSALGSLRDRNLRQELGTAAAKLSAAIFSKEKIEEIVKDLLKIIK